ncbi:MAG TPA: hypothetical protein VGD56_08695 [Gemmatirosa sp.]
MPRRPTVLVATTEGCLPFTHGEPGTPELPGRQVGPLAPEPSGACLAVIDGTAVWRRSGTGVWSPVVDVGIAVQSIAVIDGTILVGGMGDAVVLRIAATGAAATGAVERLDGFDRVPGRETWFAGGPPLGVRSLTAAMHGTALLAAVHVGGIPRSVDGGASWIPTIPVMYDVHEVHAHPDRSLLVAAAAAVGLCVSIDGGVAWTVLAEGLDGMTCLAVAVLPDEVLFSVQDGPFATRSQVWRWPIGGTHIEPVRDGLPAWFDGKVDTGWIATGQGRAAIIDGGGNLWCSRSGSTGWERVAAHVPNVLGLAIV